MNIICLHLVQSDKAIYIDANKIFIMQEFTNELYGNFTSIESIAEGRFAVNESVHEIVQMIKAGEKKKYETRAS